jgi:hypothetical protein
MVGDRRTIDSVVTVAVDEAIKGEPGSTVFVRVPGGEVGRYRRFMVGAPSFTPGEDIVLFLTDEHRRSRCRSVSVKACIVSRTVQTGVRWWPRR